MEFETTDGYGLATRTEGGGGVKVTIGALVAGDKLLSVTGSTTYPGQMPQGLTAAEYRNTIKDQETAYIVPSEVRYVWGGAAIENNKAIRAEMLVNYKNENEEGVNRGLVEKVDFLAHIPYVVRKAVHVFAKTKPYIYQVSFFSLNIIITNGYPVLESIRASIGPPRRSSRSHQVNRPRYCIYRAVIYLTLIYI